MGAFVIQKPDRGEPSFKFITVNLGMAEKSRTGKNNGKKQHFKKSI